MTLYPIAVELSPVHGDDGAALFAPTPSADDVKWARAAALRGVWCFARVERLEALTARSRRIEDYLLRERCDATGDLGRVLTERWQATRRRSAKLAERARMARRHEKDFERKMAESAALDNMQRGLIPRDLADLIARTSLVGHDDGAWN